MSTLCRMDRGDGKRAHDVLMTLGLEPLADTELVLDGAKKTGLLLGRLTTLVKDSEDLEDSRCQQPSQ